MEFRRTSRLIVAAVAVVVLGAACSHIPGIGSKASASPAQVAGPSGTPLAKAGGGLDAQVAMPPGFPADVPVYGNARLTAAASFISTGEAAWGMEWESPDATTKVQAALPKLFAAGDWTLTVTNSGAGTYAATIARKSNPHITGTLAITNDVSVTRILLSLVVPG